MDDLSDPRPPLGVTALIGRTFRLLGANFGFLYPLGFLPALFLAALDALFLPEPAAMQAGALASLGGIIGLAAVVASLVIGAIVSGILALAALDALLEKRHTLDEYLAQTLRHALPIVVLSLLLGVAVGLGALLLVVPGLYLMARYLPWTPAVVFENAGWSGLGRAQELTLGYRWPLVGAVLIMGILTVLVLIVIGPLMGLAASGIPVLGVLVEALFTGLFYVLTGAFSAVTYLRLRELQEGATVREIAASID